MAVGGLLRSQPDREEVGHPRVVGATRYAAEAHRAEMTAMSQDLLSRGKLARWWSFPLSDDAQAALRAWPYLYIYLGQPTQTILSRLRIIDFRTLPGSQGMPCPWPEYEPADTAGKTRAGPARIDIFKTWFLIDEVEPLPDPISLNELRTADSQSVLASSLLNGFAIWQLRELAGSGAADGLNLLLRGGPRNEPDQNGRPGRAGAGEGLWVAPWPGGP